MTWHRSDSDAPANGVSVLGYWSFTGDYAVVHLDGANDWIAISQIVLRPDFWYQLPTPPA